MCTKGINEETTWRNAMENEKVTVAIESNEASKNLTVLFRSKLVEVLVIYPESFLRIVISL